MNAYIREEFYEDGTLRLRESYHGNIKDGETASWYENGNLKQRANYSSGFRNGLVEWWHQDGRKLHRYNCTMGKRDGVSEWWFDTGQMESASLYVNDNKHGESISFNCQGEIVDNSYYVKGAILIGNLNNIDMQDDEKFELQMMYGGSWLS